MSRRDWPVDFDPVFKCWLWTGKVGRNGYPLMRQGNRIVMAYRAIYEAEVGPIPEGLVADHLCRRILCCNPRHIEPVTKSVNEQRKYERRRLAIKKCPRGHVIVHAARLETGGRLCVTCMREEPDDPTDSWNPWG